MDVTKEESNSYGAFYLCQNKSEQNTYLISIYSIVLLCIYIHLTFCFFLLIVISPSYHTTSLYDFLFTFSLIIANGLRKSRKIGAYYKITCQVSDTN